MGLGGECDVDAEIASILLSRLALSLLIDSLQDNGANEDIISLILPLFQNLYRSADSRVS